MCEQASISKGVSKPLHDRIFPIPPSQPSVWRIWSLDFLDLSPHSQGQWFQRLIDLLSPLRRYGAWTSSRSIIRVSVVAVLEGVFGDPGNAPIICMEVSRDFHVITELPKAFSLRILNWAMTPTGCVFALVLLSFELRMIHLLTLWTSLPPSLCWTFQALVAS